LSFPFLWILLMAKVKSSVWFSPTVSYKMVSYSETLNSTSYSVIWSSCSSDVTGTLLVPLWGLLLALAVSRPALGPTQPPIQWVPGILSRGYSGRGVKLTTHLHLVLRLRMRGAIPPLPHMSQCLMAWCLVKHRDNFTFTLPLVWRVCEHTLCFLNTFPTLYSHHRNIHYKEGAKIILLVLINSYLSCL